MINPSFKIKLIPVVSDSSHDDTSRKISRESSRATSHGRLKIGSQTKSRPKRLSVNECSPAWLCDDERSTSERTAPQAHKDSEPRRKKRRTSTSIVA